MELVQPEVRTHRIIVQSLYNVFRHRLTDSFVAMLLQDELAHPHGVLNRYIKGLTKYEAHDADEFTAIEGPCDVQPFFNNIGSIVADMHQSSQPFVDRLNHYFQPPRVYGLPFIKSSLITLLQGNTPHTSMPRR